MDIKFTDGSGECVPVGTASRTLKDVYTEENSDYNNYITTVCPEAANFGFIGDID